MNFNIDSPMKLLAVVALFSGTALAIPTSLITLTSETFNFNSMMALLALAVMWLMLVRICLSTINIDTDGYF